MSIEKEKLKEESQDALDKVNALQTKISELHEKNRKSLEENTKLMERHFVSSQIEAESRQTQVQELQLVINCLF